MVAYRFKAAGWGLRQAYFWVTALGLAIIALHFHGLLASSLNDVVWGISISLDPLGDVYLFHRLLTQVGNGCIGHNSLASFPFGEMDVFSINWLFTPSFIVAILLVFLTGKVVLSFNGAIMIMFLLNLLISYTAFMALFKDRWLALVPAVLMTFSSYSYAHSWAHLGMLPLFYFPWFLVAFIRLLESERIYYALGAALAAALALYSSPYYAYFIAWMAIAILAGHLITDFKRYVSRRLVVAYGVAVAFCFALIWPYIYWNLVKDFGWIWGGAPSDISYSNKLVHILSFSARPSDYILPNVHNFLYGHYFSSMVSDPMPMRGAWSDELPIYVGALPAIGMITIIVAIFIPRMRRRLFAHRPPVIISLLLIMVVSFLISLPYQLNIFGFDVPMPNALFRHLVPFRSYSRFGIVFLMALATLIAQVIDGKKWRRIAVAALICACVFESMPETKLFNVSPEMPYIKFLRQRPERVIMRFEANNGRFLDFERILTGKMAINGGVNNAFGLTDMVLGERWPQLNFGHLGQLGVELLVVNGKMQPSPQSLPYLSRIYDSDVEQIEIWKVAPGHDPRITSLLQPYLAARQNSPCYITSKEEATVVMQQLLAMIRG